MQTIQDIENKDLTKLDIKTLCSLRMDLQQSFYRTSIKELTSDGRHLKTIIGDELSRVLNELVNRRS